MASIKSMFNEVQYELVKIILLNVFLSTVILFLAADLLALIFNMPIWYVVVLSFVYFLAVFIFEMRKIGVKQVEQSNPELKEMLRTAKDNIEDDSLMAHALFQEVMEKMRHVSSGTFIDFKKLMTKLVAIFALAIVLVSIAFFNVNIAKFDNPLERPLSALSGFFGGGSTEEIPGFNAEDAQDDVFGESRIADLGDDRLTATINPSLDQPDFNNVDPAEPSNDPLQDLSQGGAEFNEGGEAYEQEGLDERDLRRSYEYAKRTQE